MANWALIDRRMKRWWFERIGHIPQDVDEHTDCKIISVTVLGPPRDEYEREMERLGMWPGESSPHTRDPFASRELEYAEAIAEMRCSRQFRPGKVRGRDYAPVREMWDSESTVGEFGRYQG